MNSLFVVNNLTKVYNPGRNNQAIVLKNISFEIQKGVVTSIYGPSGGGKSTLLNILGKLDNVYAGQITYKGQDLQKIQRRKYFQHEVAFIFQNYNLVESQTVQKNLMFALEKANLTKSQKTKLIKEKLNYLNLLDKINSKVNELSGGQKQRVAIARALVQETEVIIADEPTGALDQENSQNLIEIFKDLASKQGKTIILVTHSKQVLEASDNVIKLDYGIISEQINNVAGTEVNPMQKHSQNFFYSAFNTFKKSITEIKQNAGNNSLMAGILIFAAVSILSVVAIAGGALNSLNTPEQIKHGTQDNELYIEFPNNENENIDLGVSYESKLGYASDAKLSLPNKTLESVTVLSGIYQREFESVMYVGNKISKDDEVILNNTQAIQYYYAKKNIGNLYKEVKAIPKEIKSEDLETILGNEITISFINKDGQPQELKRKIAGVSEINSRSGSIIIVGASDTNLFTTKYNLANQGRKPLQKEYASTAYYQFKNTEDRDKAKEIYNQKYALPAVSGAKTNQDLINDYNKQNENILNGIIAAFSLAVIVVSILVGIIVYSTIEKERKRLALMQLFGYKQWEIIRYSLFSIIIITAGSILIAGLITNYAVIPIVTKSFNNIKMYLPIENVRFTVILFTILVAFVAFFALLRIRKVQPIEAIQK
jgi:putative ABC transport system permease protein